jgi:hypothetical protein
MTGGAVDHVHAELVGAGMEAFAGGTGAAA